MLSCYQLGLYYAIMIADTMVQESLDIKMVLQDRKLMSDPYTKRILWYLFAGSRGGTNRVNIIELLKEHPYNINQLAEALKLDYKAIQYHISVLEKDNIISRMGEKYGVQYFLSNYLEANIDAFNEIRSQMRSMKI
jgi:DNA-binding transcriptional ArsR family regulator